MSTQYKATKDDVRALLHHYQNLYNDTPLLVQFCAGKGLTLEDGFRSVCREIETLNTQLSSFN